MHSEQRCARCRKRDRSVRDGVKDEENENREIEKETPKKRGKDTVPLELIHSEQWGERGLEGEKETKGKYYMERRTN